MTRIAPCGNELTGNGLPGVALHQHVSNNSIQNLSDNLIIGNYIAGDAGDNDLPTTPPTGISLLAASAVNGTVITLNEFSGDRSTSLSTTRAEMWMCTTTA